MVGSAIDRKFERRLSGLINSREPRPLSHGLRGLEKESLRVTSTGRVARTPHPAALGSALTNPNITTDYSEALLELVTPTFTDSEALLDYLRGLHHFVYSRIDDELLWAASMPCELAGDDDVPIAYYGESHQGKFKEIYRRGLLTRYGGMMQAIAGVHFNYSFPLTFWPLWGEQLQSRSVDRDFISACYFDLLRNFRRHGWLISFLFGASPALCRSFLQGRPDSGLLAWRGDTAYGRSATSLRMSDIGYRNRDQAAVHVSANSLRQYLQDLMRAAHTPHPPFAALGVQVNGEYRQLNANVLQIENEYYSSIRPKRVPRTDESTGQALAREGVEYVEVRALDLDAFEAVGTSASELRFVEALLALLLIKDSPPISSSEQEACDHNYLVVARRGREPGLKLVRDGRNVPLAICAAELLESMRGICELLDQGDPQRRYGASLDSQLLKLEQPQLLPAARMLHEMTSAKTGFADYSLDLSVRHRAEVLSDRSGAASVTSEMAAQAEESLESQRRMDAAVTGSFSDHLKQRFGTSVTR